MIYPVLLTREGADDDGECDCALVRENGRVDFVAADGLSSCWGNYGNPPRALDILRTLGYTRVLA